MHASRLRAAAAVRACAQELNRQIMAWLRNPTGPRVVVRPGNVDEVVARWRADRTPPPVTPPAAPSARPGLRWWPWRRRTTAPDAPALR